MSTPQRLVAVSAGILCLVAAAIMLTPDAPPAAGAAGLEQIDYLIVIYLENHSFDNLYGLFPGAEGLSGARDAPPQTDLNNVPYATLPQPVDTNRRPPGPDPRFPANLPNRPFDISQYAPPDQKVGDLVHRYYHEQLQINSGRMDRYVAWSDAAGLAMGYYDTSQLPLARWAEQYTLADYFHQAAFGGSFLNHFWLVCACTPVWPDAPPDMIAVPSDNPRRLQDRSVTPDGFAVNSSQPQFAPYAAGTPADHRLPAQTLPHIGDRLDAAGVSWAYYAGGWNDAVAGHPDPLFAYHHQPFNYFASVGGNAAARALHLKDETDFGAALRDGTLPSVSWIKPMGLDNEHPGYADVIRGERHVEDLLRQI
jgi:phospholipase C